MIRIWNTNLRLPFNRFEVRLKGNDSVVDVIAVMGVVDVVVVVDESFLYF